jgi:hypothetical protein
LKPVAEPVKSDSFLSSTDRHSTPSKKHSSTRAESAPRSPEDLRHSAIQATDEDISNFTEVTLGHSWVLPPTIKSKTDSPKALNQSSVSTLSSANSKTNIAEQNFDDFEPFIMVPRSPDSKNKYHPNLRDFPMPSTGPPQGKKPNLDFKKKQNKSPPKKSRTTPIEFQGLSLKKTTLSRTEAQTLHKSASSSSTSRPGTAEATSGSNEKPEVNTNQRVLKKQKMKRTGEKEPTAPFFFPALLSAAPHINLAPVGFDITKQENALLYEDTENF